MTARIVDVSIKGRRFGYLTIEYAEFSGHRIACRCICSRLTFVAAADLVAGRITSCGCQPAPAEYHQQLAELSAQLAREVLFTVGKAR
jgi:hypothetical protein